MRGNSVGQLNHTALAAVVFLNIVDEVLANQRAGCFLIPGDGGDSLFLAVGPVAVVDDDGNAGLNRIRQRNAGAVGGDGVNHDDVNVVGNHVLDLLGLGLVVQVAVLADDVSAVVCAECFQSLCQSCAPFVALVADGAADLLAFQRGGVLQDNSGGNAELSSLALGCDYVGLDSAFSSGRFFSRGLFSGCFCCGRLRSGRLGLGVGRRGLRLGCAGNQAQNHDHCKKHRDQFLHFVIPP